MQPIARYRPHPLQQRGHAARRGQAADRSAEASTRVDVHLKVVRIVTEN